MESPLLVSTKASRLGGFGQSSLHQSRNIYRRQRCPRDVTSSFWVRRSKSSRTSHWDRAQNSTRRRMVVVDDPVRTGKEERSSTGHGIHFPSDYYQMDASPVRPKWVQPQGGLSLINVLQRSGGFGVWIIVVE